MSQGRVERRSFGLPVQMAVAVAAALLFGLFLQGSAWQWLRAAVPGLRHVVDVVTFPALIIAVLVDGGHGTSYWAFVLGLVVEFLVLLWLFRLLGRAYAKLDARLSA